jgi:hypothetical protein
MPYGCMLSDIIKFPLFSTQGKKSQIFYEACLLNLEDKVDNSESSVEGPGCSFWRKA